MQPSHPTYLDMLLLGVIISNSSCFFHIRYRIHRVPSAQHHASLSSSPDSMAIGRTVLERACSLVLHRVIDQKQLQALDGLR